jgi:hypothetical protein
MPPAWLSHRFEIGVSMLVGRERVQGVSVLRGFGPVFGIASLAVAIIAAEPTRGQTNIDQGKPASELFANYCAVCHKSTRGLANGRNGLTLSLFLREHYAASSQQAAALAAYVISAGGSAPAKPDRAKSDEPKGQEAKGQESKGREAKPRAASASPKGEPDKPPQAGQPVHEEAAPVQQEPAPVVAAPAVTPPNSAEAPELRSTTNAGVSADQSNDNAPVPRDNIPD